jgi:hypothetical protein
VLQQQFIDPEAPIDILEQKSADEMASFILNQQMTAIHAVDFGHGYTLQDRRLTIEAPVPRSGHPPPERWPMIGVFTRRYELVENSAAALVFPYRTCLHCYLKSTFVTKANHLPRKNTLADKQHKRFGYHFRVNAAKYPRRVFRSENFRRRHFQTAPR